MFIACLPETGVFYCHTLDCHFTDNGIQAYKLQWFTRASGQSAVRRRTRAIIVTVGVFVIVIVTVIDTSLSNTVNSTRD